MAVACKRVRLRSLDAVELRAFQQYAPQTEALRAVRILRALALGVVLSVHRGPFPGDHSRRQPQPEAEEVAYRRMQLERAMRLVTMEINGDGCDGDVGQ
jgi:hypothetical protein